MNLYGRTSVGALFRATVAKRKEGVAPTEGATVKAIAWRSVFEVTHPG